MDARYIRWEREQESQSMELEALAVVGPTASGKTRRAVSISRMLGGEIVSADSRQLYRGMTIGTGKDLCEYQEIPYHLIDIAEAGERYDLYRYLKCFHSAISAIRSSGKIPVICGGTGMYVESALNGIVMPEVPRNEDLRNSLSDKSLPELTAILAQYKTLHNKTDVDNCNRALRAIEIALYYENNPDKAALAQKGKATPLCAEVIGIDIPREERRARISSRLRARLDEGMVEEVRSLLASGLKPEDLIYYGLEYKFITLHVTGEISYDRMVNDLETAIHQFAKRQMTWFRGMEKRGTKINWVPYDLSDDVFNGYVRDLISGYDNIKIVLETS